MYGFLRQPRWIGLGLLVVLLVVAFLELAAWQERRHDERRASNATVEANVDAPVVPVADLLTVGDDVADDQEWRRVELVGSWDQSDEVLVRNRPRDGRPGFLVVTPLVTAEGPALLVERGWIPAADTVTDAPEVPAAQDGEVTVVARLRPAEDARQAGDLPDGQVLGIDTDAIADSVDAPLFGGYGQLASEEPAPAEPLELADDPTVSAGPHLGYAVQWVLFSVIAVVGVVVLVRREADYRRGKDPAALSG